MTAIILAATTALALLVGSAWSPHHPRSVHQATTAAARRPPQRNALVELVERTSRDVRSGTALRVALQDATRHQPELLPGLHEQLAQGTPVVSALAQADNTRSTDAAFVVHGLQVAAHTGGAMADTLDRIVAVVRERQAWRAERHAQAAQARLSARVLTVLPLIVAAWGIASGPRVRQAYAQSPATAMLTGIGVALNLIGWWWMNRLVRGRWST